MSVLGIWDRGAVDTYSTIVAGRVETQQQYTSHEYKQDEVQLLGPMNQFKDASMILNNTETSRY